MPNGYKPVPTVAPKMIPTPEVRIHIPQVNFTQAIGQALGDLGTGYQTLGAATGQVGSALASAGRMAEGAGNEIMGRALAIQEVKNEAETNELRTKWELESGQVEAQYLATMGSNASDGLPAYMKNMEKLRNDYAAKSSNPAVKRRFDNQTMQSMGRSIFSGARHAAVETKRYAIDAAEGAINTTKQDIEKHWDKPEVFEQGKADIIRHRQQQRYIAGWSEDHMNVQINEDMADLRAKHINGMSKERPFQAYEEFQAAVKSGELFGPQKDRLEATVVNNLIDTVARNSSDNATADLRGKEPDESKSVTQRQEQAREEARKAMPEGTSERDRSLVEDRAVGETDRKWRQWKIGNEQFHRDQLNTVIGGISGAFTDGNIPKSTDDFKTVPKLWAAYDSLNEREKMQVRGWIYTANQREQRVDPLTSMEEFGRIKGLAINKPDEFFAMSPYDPKLKLNPTERRAWIRLRDEMSRDPTGRAGLVNKYMNVLRTAKGGEMQALGVYRRDPKDPDDYDKVTNAVQQAVEVFHEKNGRMPTDQEFVKDLAPDIIKYTPSSWFPWRSEERPSYMSPPPQEWIDEHEKRMKAKGLPPANQWELERDWTRLKLQELEMKRGASKTQTIGTAPSAP